MTIGKPTMKLTMVAVIGTARGTSLKKSACQIGKHKRTEAMMAMPTRSTVPFGVSSRRSFAPAGPPIRSSVVLSCPSKPIADIAG